MSSYEELSMVLEVSVIVYSVFSNGGIIIAYAIIYVIIRRVYRDMLKNSEGEQSQVEKKDYGGVIQQNMQSLFILFFSIC
jgi:hypothetical protein